MVAIDTPTAPPAPTANATAVVPDGNHVAHAYCQACQRSADDPVALCGHRPRRLLNRPAGPGDPLCVVCVDLYHQPCPHCGHTMGRRDAAA